MSEASQFVHAKGRRSTASFAGSSALVPFGLRMLLHLTTNHWNAGPDVHSAVGSAVEALRADGWWVRGAWPRNYMLWRQGRTMKDPRRPVLVLPQVHGRVSALQRSVFLAVEIVRAKERLRRGSRADLSDLAMAELDDMVQRITEGSALRVVDPLRLHREAAAQFETTTVCRV